MTEQHFRLAVLAALAAYLIGIAALFGRHFVWHLRQRRRSRVRRGGSVFQERR